VRFLCSSTPCLFNVCRIVDLLSVAVRLVEGKEVMFDVPFQGSQSTGDIGFMSSVEERQTRPVHSAGSVLLHSGQTFSRRSSCPLGFVQRANNNEVPARGSTVALLTRSLCSTNSSQEHKHLRSRTNAR